MNDEESMSMTFRVKNVDLWNKLIEIEKGVIEVKEHITTVGERSKANRKMITALAGTLGTITVVIAKFLWDIMGKLGR